GLPWWAQKAGGGPAWLADANAERDKLQTALEHLTSGETEDPKKGPKFKRVKREEYLVGLAGGPLRRAVPATDIIMRNRTPGRRQERTSDSRRRNTTEQGLRDEVGGLFAQTVLAEGQLF